MYFTLQIKWIVDSELSITVLTYNAVKRKWKQKEGRLGCACSCMFLWESVYLCLCLWVSVYLCMFVVAREDVWIELVGCNYYFIVIGFRIHTSLYISLLFRPVTLNCFPFASVVALPHPLFFLSFFIWWFSLFAFSSLPFISPSSPLHLPFISPSSPISHSSPSASHSSSSSHSLSQFFPVVLTVFHLPSTLHLSTFPLVVSHSSVTALLLTSSFPLRRGGLCACMPLDVWSAILSLSQQLQAVLSHSADTFLCEKPPTACQAAFFQRKSVLSTCLETFAWMHTRVPLSLKGGPRSCLSMDC